MKHATIVAICLAVSGGLGWFFGKGQRQSPLTSPEAAPILASAALPSKIESPNAEDSPRFAAQLAIFQTIDSASFEELWALWHDPANRICQDRILARLIELDPVSAADRLRATGDQRRLSRMMQHWSLKDPVAAFRHLDAMPDFGASGNTFSHNYVSDRALAEAMKRGSAALTLEVLDRTTTIGDGIFQTASANSLNAFLNLLIEENYQHPCVDFAFAALAKKDHEAAKRWADENTGWNNKGMVKSLITGAFAKDFEFGMEQVLKYFEDYPYDDTLLGNLALNAADKDPQQAIELIEKIGISANQAERDHLARSVIYGTTEEERPAITAELERRGLYTTPEEATQWPLRSEDALRDLLTMDDPAAEADRLSRYELPVPASRAAEIISESDPATISSAIAEAIAFQLPTKILRRRSIGRQASMIPWHCPPLAPHLNVGSHSIPPPP
ncbi:MAG: hypothetical protein KDN22_14865 [Verrucomicrobiae bacterium]|nr:hypothetical protein [Verrucomicrobiae bacterium]